MKSSMNRQRVRGVQSAATIAPKGDGRFGVCAGRARAAVPLAIIGGGAAGLFAAAEAARRRLPCLLVERKARLAAKLLMTANGRCNFTRDVSPERFLADLGPAAPFATEAIRDCPPRCVIETMRSLGVGVRRMQDGRMFPADGKAATVVHAFGDFLRERAVPILTNCPVTGLVALKQGFSVATPNFSFQAENVLVATGGVSYPKTGSVGDGQEFAKAFGHRIVPYRPGLIGLETSDARVVSLAGRRFEDGRVTLYSGGRAVFDYAGEVDFERFGLSGAAIYNAQRFIMHNALRDWELEVAAGGERMRFGALRSRPLKEAIVTLGGVATDEIDPATMESRLVPHLYFAGEVMDIDGPTGGYNLTLAFATARKAVAAICENVRGS